MAEGEFTLVRQHLQEALAQPSFEFSYSTPNADIDLYVMMVDVAAQQRDLPALQKYAPLAEELAWRNNHPLYQAIVHRALGIARRLTGEYAEAETRLEQALALFRSLDARWQIGRTLAELGELALARADSPAGRHFFSQALTAFEELGAAPDATRTRLTLETLS